MKRMFSLVLAGALALGAASAVAGERYSQSVESLPKPAREMLAKHFPNATLNHVKIDTGGLFEGHEYDAVMSDGTEVEFDAKGKWTEVSCGPGVAVPQALILPSITNYVKKHYPSAHVSQVKVERNKYELELSNGIELEFDNKGNFLRLDR